MGRKALKRTGPMTAAERQRERRIRLDVEVIERDSHEWTEAVCLRILAGKRWRGGSIDKAAWKRLGKIRGFM
ncbi:MAG: hypothetical protein ACPW60_10190 [Methylohalobius sp. ZOD2]